MKGFLVTFLVPRGTLEYPRDRVDTLGSAGPGVHQGPGANQELLPNLLSPMAQQGGHWDFF